MSLQKAIDEAPLGKTTRIYILDGKWDKSKIDTKGKKIRFDLYPGAELKKSK